MDAARSALETSGSPASAVDGVASSGGDRVVCRVPFGRRRSRTCFR